MRRGSDKHGPRHDEALAEELDGMIRSDRPTRAEEWADPEPPADDDPAADPHQWEQDTSGSPPSDTTGSPPSD